MNRKERRAQDFKPKMQDLTFVIELYREKLSALDAVRDLQLQALNRVRELHSLKDMTGDSSGVFVCQHCAESYPCKTIQVLDALPMQPCAYCSAPVPFDVWKEESEMCVDCSNAYYEHESDETGYADYQHDQMKEKEIERDE